MELDMERWIVDFVKWLKSQTQYNALLIQLRLCSNRRSTTATSQMSSRVAL